MLINFYFLFIKINNPTQHKHNKKTLIPAPIPIFAFVLKPEMTSVDVVVVLPVDVVVVSPIDVVDGDVFPIDVIVGDISPIGVVVGDTSPIDVVVGNVTPVDVMTATGFIFVVVVVFRLVAEVPLPQF